MCINKTIIDILSTTYSFIIKLIYYILQYILYDEKGVCYTYFQISANLKFYCLSNISYIHRTII
jgi:hypothetical protein